MSNYSDKKHAVSFSGITGFTISNRLGTVAMNPPLKTAAKNMAPSAFAGVVTPAFYGKCIKVKSAAERAPSPRQDPEVVLTTILPQTRFDLYVTFERVTGEPVSGTWTLPGFLLTSNVDRAAVVRDLLTKQVLKWPDTDEWLSLSNTKIADISTSAFYLTY